MSRSRVYKFVFLAFNGPGPWSCFFCEKDVIVDWDSFDDRRLEKWSLIVHHKDGDHANNHKSNLVAAHNCCHASHHSSEKPGRSHSIETRMKLSKAHRGKSHEEWTKPDRTLTQCPKCDAPPFKGAQGLKIHMKAKHV